MNSTTAGSNSIIKTYEFYLNDSIKPYKKIIKGADIKNVNFDQFLRSVLPDITNDETLILFIKPIIYNRHKISEEPKSISPVLASK